MLLMTITSSLLLVEAFRREIIFLLLTHTTCVEARERALGESPESVRNRASEFFEKSLGKKLGNHLEDATRATLYHAQSFDVIRWLDVGDQPGSISERWIRYPQFIAFSTKRGRKHHQELRVRCLYPFL